MRARASGKGKGRGGRSGHSLPPESQGDPLHTMLGMQMFQSHAASTIVPERVGTPPAPHEGAPSDMGWASYQGVSSVPTYEDISHLSAPTSAHARVCRHYINKHFCSHFKRTGEECGFGHPGAHRDNEGVLWQPLNFGQRHQPSQRSLVSQSDMQSAIDQRRGVRQSASVFDSLSIEPGATAQRFQAGDAHRSNSPVSPRPSSLGTLGEQHMSPADSTRTRAGPESEPSPVSSSSGLSIIIDPRVDHLFGGYDTPIHVYTEGEKYSVFGYNSGTENYFEVTVGHRDFLLSQCASKGDFLIAPDKRLLQANVRCFELVDSDHVGKTYRVQQGVEVLLPWPEQPYSRTTVREDPVPNVNEAPIRTSSPEVPPFPTMSTTVGASEVPGIPHFGTVEDPNFGTVRAQEEATPPIIAPLPESTIFSSVATSSDTPLFNVSSTIGPGRCPFLDKEHVPLLGTRGETPPPYVWGSPNRTPSPFFQEKEVSQKSVSELTHAGYVQLGPAVRSHVVIMVTPGTVCHEEDSR